MFIKIYTEPKQNRREYGRTYAGCGAACHYKQGPGIRPEKNKRS
ncbi:hypothetical protein CHK_2032 [Christensenella hongkongensis]|uniref:Uncharacterized protein n=1 Tax=Christensenella hongkongensis TaxID=270498 RepID=A0A0M2NJL6_9FIRM|nr:hypothetical protein CHK_2032 [Christensenella hongkongensis]